MNELIPPADPLGIPAPVSIFQFLYILTFVLHVIFMNFVLGGTIMITFNEWIFGKRPDVVKADRLMLKIMLVALSLAITMGVAPLLFVQVMFGNFFYTTNIIMGLIWFSIFILVIIAFYLIYLLITKRSDDQQSNMLTRSIVVVNSILFLVVAFIFTNNAVLMENPEYWKAMYAGESSIIVPENYLWARFFHNVFGSCAVAGLWCAVIAKYQDRYHPQNADSSHWLYKSGILWTKISTVFAIIAGVSLLLLLPGERLKSFMDMNVLFMGWSLAIVLVLFLFMFLGMAYMKKDKPIFLWLSVGIMTLILFGMSMGREHLRIISIEPYFKLEEFTLNPSYSSLAMFLVTFIIGLGVLAYLIRLIYSMPSGDESDTEY